MRDKKHAFHGPRTFLLSLLKTYLTLKVSKLKRNGRLFVGPTD